MVTVAVILVLSYLVGSIPASLWTGKLLYDIDLREHGSGNAGATNAFRVLGFKAGLITTIFDVSKGVIAAAFIASIRLDPLPRPELVPWEAEMVIALVAGLVAVVGHMFPVWAGFRGGKGMNTSAGVLLALTPITTLITISVFALVLLLSRYVSLASLMAAIAFPSTVAIRRYVFGIDTLDPSLLFLGLLLAAGVIYAHRANIGRLRAGNENRIRSFRPARGLRGRGELET